MRERRQTTKAPSILPSAAARQNHTCSELRLAEVVSQHVKIFPESSLRHAREMLLHSPQQRVTEQLHLLSPGTQELRVWVLRAAGAMQHHALVERDVADGGEEPLEVNMGVSEVPVTLEPGGGCVEAEIRQMRAAMAASSWVQTAAAAAS